MDSILEVRHLKKYFYFNTSGGALHAVDDISFSICKGETFSIVGESGCGKSTTGYALLGMLKPTAGELYFEGRPLESDDEEGRRMVRRQMQIVFQDPFASLNPKMCIGESIAEPLRAAGTPQEKIPGLVADLLDMVGLHRSYADRLPNQFSGGQRQRLTIARALVRKPEVLILDDSASALDFATDAALRHALRELPWKPAVVIISQRTASIRFADEILVLDDGKLAGRGTHDELLQTCEVYREIYESQFKKEDAR